MSGSVTTTSTASLDDGFGGVGSSNLTECSDEEQRLLLELQELERSLEAEENAKAPMPDPEVASAATLPATYEELKELGLHTTTADCEPEVIDADEFDDTEMKETLHAMWRVKQEAVEENQQQPAPKLHQAVPDQKAHPVAAPADPNQKPRPVATPARAPTTAAAPPADDDEEPTEGLVKTEPRAKPKKEFTRQERLVLAARGRIGRTMRPKTKRTDLVPPAYVQQHFKEGHKKQLAQMLVDCNFDKARFFNLVEKTVLKRDEQVLEREEGWYSEAEMKADLKWSPSRIAGAMAYCRARAATHVRKNMYDNVEEFWVLLREKANKKETLLREEKHHESEAASHPNFIP
ncbi:unnamed protein product [Symbiodinium sp. CCMP2592]|nr:unnamed protein product [Symbiodinium sp. CCMP2592]